jgi:hypothetical protein
VIILFSVAIYTVTAGNTIGTDIFVFYLAGRSSFIDGQGPYIPNNYLQSQILTYGHPAEIGEDPLIFGYPPFSLFPILPLFFIPFEWTQAIWFALMFICVTLIPFLVFPDTPRWLPPTIFLIYPFSFGLLMGNFAVPIGMIVLAVYGYFFNSTKSNRYIDLLAGVALAWCTAKPQFIWIFLIFYFIVAFKQKRNWFIYSYIGTLTTFLALSFAVSATWITDWLIQIKDYARYIQSTPHLIQYFNLLLNKNEATLLAGLVSVIIIGWLIVILIRWYQREKDPLQVLCWIGIISHLFYPGGVAYGQIIFIIPFLIWLFTTSKLKPKLSIFLWIIAIFISWFELVQFRLMPDTIIFSEWLFCFYLIWMIITHVNKTDKNHSKLLIK